MRPSITGETLLTKEESPVLEADVEVGGDRMGSARRMSIELEPSGAPHH